MSIPNTHDQCYKQLRFSKHKFTWVIKQFSSQELNDESIMSSTFPSERHLETKWRLQLKKIYNDHHHAHFLSLDLKLLSVEADLKKVKGSISILDSEREKNNIQTFEDAYTVKEGEDQSKVDLIFSSWPTFINTSFLSDVKRHLLPNDELTLHCELTLQFGPFDSMVSSTISDIPECDMAVNVGSLMEGEKFSDVLLCAGNKEFKAHKNILACRSPVFEAMFTHQMEENKQDRVFFEDIDPETLRELIHYMYTGKANLEQGFAAKLLPAADKYDLGRLKTMCEMYLGVSLSVETAAHCLLLADMHNAQYLKESTLQFITAFSKEVVQTQSWKLMVTTRPQVLDDCFQRMLPCSKNDAALSTKEDETTGVPSIQESAKT